jgi:hypothetical protein
MWLECVCAFERKSDLDTVLYARTMDVLCMIKVFHLLPNKFGTDVGSYFVAENFPEPQEMQMSFVICINSMKTCTSTQLF